MTDLPAAKIAHAQALVAWNGMEYDAAMKLAETQTCEQLESQSYASSSIAAAKAGIEKYLLGGKQIDAQYLTGEAHAPAGYFQKLRVDIDARMDSKAVASGIMSILGGIHDAWVSSNAKKYNRDAEKGDKRLFQHLPTQLIGLDEVAKDLMFLAPILSEIGICVGNMQQIPYGAFVPTKGFAEAYEQYSQSYVAEKGLTKDNLGEQMAKVIGDYSPLQGESDVDKARREYMLQRTDLLAAQTVKNLGLEKVQTNDLVR